MIGRLWRGWTSPEDADRYEELVRTKILPGFYAVAGYKGAYLFRRDGADETEFVALTLFEEMKAVRAFAGADYEAAVVPPEARELLSRFDRRSAHYEVVYQPE
jgi:heme-degrading monooxygenase HmoA